MKKQHWLIAIEGIDGVGKTTIAKLLCEKLNAFPQKTPLPSLKWAARFLDKFHNPEIETIGYFLLTIITSLYIQQRLKYQSIVCDKYILNTIVTQTCLGGKLVKLIKLIRYYLVRKPNYTFCLTISNKNQLMKRLKQRGKLDANDQQLLPYCLEIQRKYLEFPEVIPIDTTEWTPDKILMIILNHLKY